MKRLLQILLPLLILVIAALGASRLAQMRTMPEAEPVLPMHPLVQVEAARTSAVTLEVRAQGNVMARTATRLLAEVPARVLELAPALASGGFFAEGEVLLELDSTDLRLDLELARALVARAELTLAEEEAAAAVAREEWLSLGRQDAPTDLVLRAPQLAHARAELAAARAAQTKAERDVERCTVRAPYMGRVQSRNVDRGQYVERGSELARIYAVDQAEVRLPVLDAELARLELSLWSEDESLRQGPAVTLEADFAGQLGRWQGRIVRSEGEIDARTRSLILVAQVDDPYGLASRSGPPLLAGLYVNATIAGRKLQDAVVLPPLALLSGNRVHIFAGEGVLEIRSVDVLAVDSERVVLAAGVQAGELVILTPIESPVAGMHLRRDSSAGTGAVQ